jgi:hypothetical protein
MRVRKMTLIKRAQQMMLLGVAMLMKASKMEKLIRKNLRTGSKMASFKLLVAKNVKTILQVKPMVSKRNPRKLRMQVTNTEMRKVMMSRVKKTIRKKVLSKVNLTSRK